MEVINKNPLASDFAVLYQRIMRLAKEFDGMREHYRELYKKIVSGGLLAFDYQKIDPLKTFNVAGFINLSIGSARAAQAAVIIANDVAFIKVFDPILKTTERALRYVESGTYR